MILIKFYIIKRQKLQFNKYLRDFFTQKMLLVKIYQKHNKNELLVIVKDFKSQTYFLKSFIYKVLIHINENN